MGERFPDGAPLGTTLQWQQRSLAAVWHPCTQMQRAHHLPPLPVARAEGPWLIDAEGRRYFDATSSWWVNLFGHGDAGLRAALIDQLDTLDHVMLAGCTHAPAIRLAERLSALTAGHLGHAFYASDGASAVEIALKMAFHHWRNRGALDKREFVCIRGGYHGETLGALAVTDVPVFRDAYAPLLMHAHFAMSPDARAAQPGETAHDVAQRAADDLARVLAAQDGRVAAVIVEPLVQCAGGMAMHDAHWLREVRRLCDAHGALLIADEIAVGFGRTGTLLAFEQTAFAHGAAVWPDLMCLSKGLTGGVLPLSVVLARDAVYASFLDDDTARGFLHSHSYTGNPLACRAALATLDRFEHDAVVDVNRERAAALARAFAPLADDARVEHLRQRGMIVAFDVREAVAGARFAERFQQAGRGHGLVIRPIGRTVYVMPPYAFDDALAHWLAQRVRATLDTVAEAA